MTMSEVLATELRVQLNTLSVCRFHPLHLSSEQKIRNCYFESMIPMRNLKGKGRNPENRSVLCVRACGLYIQTCQAVSTIISFRSPQIHRFMLAIREIKITCFLVLLTQSLQTSFLKHLNLLLLAQNPFNLIFDKIIRFIDDVTNLNKQCKKHRVSLDWMSRAEQITRCSIDQP